MSDSVQPDLSESLNHLLNAVATAAATTGNEDAADLIVSDTDAREHFIEFSKQFKALTGIEMDILKAGSRNEVPIRIIAIRPENS